MATTELSTAPQELDAGMMIRRALFLLLLVGLALYFLGLDFRGLSTSKGMEQAVVSREIAKGNGFYTTILKPLAWKQIEKKVKKDKGPGEALDLTRVPDTYHSPLNPLVNSLVLGMAKNTWELGETQAIYTPDMLIAGLAMVLLLASIGINYLLVSRIFDARIGGVTALLMLLCEMLWRFSQTGLPQMLMLFLFSFGTYFLYKAVENEVQGKGTLLWISLTGGFFGLLGLAHWLTLWIFFGLLAFVVIYFSRKLLLMVVLLGIFGLITGVWGYLNYQATDNPFGAGLYVFYSGLGGTGSEETLFRDLEQTVGGLNFNGFLSKIVINSMSQIPELYAFLGGVVVAPLFFLSLMHPFRRKEIADFRWAILVMWLCAVLGMTFYGIKSVQDSPTHENNLHILFIPLMTGYGLALLSVLWNRLNIPLNIPLVRNGHFVLAIIISAVPPLMVNVPNIMRLNRMDKTLRVMYPLYVPRLLNDYAKLIPENEMIVSDIPWAVAWYGQRSSVWLPKDQSQLTRLMGLGKDKGTPISAILLSPNILWCKLNETSQMRSEYFDWRQYTLFYPALGLAKNERDTTATLEMLTADMPIKNYFPDLGGPFGRVYLFMTETKLPGPKPKETN
jgi:hypothetical protein